MTVADILLLLFAAAAAGVMNALAGGGTILTFPALVLAGLPAIAANVTSTIALLPGAAASLAGYWSHVAPQRRWLKFLLLPSLVGGGIGALLLMRTPERLFARLAPLLVLFATALFALQWLLASRRPAPDAAVPPAAPGRSRYALAVLLQLAVAVYGGYFGAGIGILMLALLGHLGLNDIHAMNGLKNVLGLAINLVAAVYFIAQGAVVWPAALVMAAGAIAGGFGGARLAQRIGRERARGAVVLIGVLLSALLFWQQWR